MNLEFVALRAEFDEQSGAKIELQDIADIAKYGERRGKRA